MKVLNFTLILLILNYFDGYSMDEETITHPQNSGYSTEKQQPIFYSQDAQYSTEGERTTSYSYYSQDAQYSTEKRPSTFSLHSNEHSTAKQQLTTYSNEKEMDTTNSNTFTFDSPVKNPQSEQDDQIKKIQLSPIGWTPPPGDGKFVIKEQYNKRLSRSSQEAKGTSIKTYITYIMYYLDHTKPPYIGITSGKGDPNNRDDVERILQRRHRGHHMESQGFGDKVEVCYVGTDKIAARYLEDYLINLLGGAKSEKREGRKSSNLIRSIDPDNPNRPKYYEIGNKKFCPPQIKYSNLGPASTQDVAKVLFNQDKENKDPNIGQMEQEDTRVIPRKLIFNQSNN